MSRPTMPRRSRGVHVQQVAAVEADRIGADLAGRIDQAEQRQHRDRLARTRLADDAEHFAGFDGEVHAIDSGEAAEVDAQVAGFEQDRHESFLSFGSSASRSPSPTRLIASTDTRIASPGIVTTHGARAM